MGLHNEGIKKITHEGLNPSYSISLYEDLKLEEIQLLKINLNNIENDIKLWYYIQQFFACSRVYYEFIRFNRLWWWYVEDFYD